MFQDSKDGQSTVFLTGLRKNSLVDHRENQNSCCCKSWSKKKICCVSCLVIVLLIGLGETISHFYNIMKEFG